jgi:hypothetical protein
MIDFDQEFFDSDKIVLETLDDLSEYMTTVDVWIKMHEKSERDVIGSNTFGFYTLHVFDSPVEIVTLAGALLDMFQAAISVETPGDMDTRETYSLTFATEQEARTQLEEIKDKYNDFWMAEDETLVDMGTLEV